MSDDLARCAEQLKGSMYYDTTSRLATLTARKLANTKTSISFGNERVRYVSDAMETQMAGGAPPTTEERAAQAERVRKMKADLTLTNFTLGDEVPVYSSVNREAMALSDTFKGAKRVAMNSELKEAVKKSSLHFGNEPILYKSTTAHALETNGSQVDQSAHFAKLKVHIVRTYSLTRI